jgi:hypothetical protein
MSTMKKLKNKQSNLPKKESNNGNNSHLTYRNSQKMIISKQTLFKNHVLILTCENKNDSEFLNWLVGNKTIDSDGLIGNVTGQIRLSDGYGEHYLILSKNNTLNQTPPTT